MKPSKEILLKLYIVENKSTRQIASLFPGSSKNEKTSKTQVVRWLKSYDIPVRRKSFNRKIKLNEKVFDDINENSAYWIGFMMSDGGARVNIDKGNFNIKISLGIIDVNHLEKFKAFLQSEHKITNDKPSGFGKKGCRTISIYSKYILEVLSKYGITTRKSLTAEVKLLDNDRHFWRGAVDGDGWITFNKTKPEIGLTGSLAMIKQFKKYVKDNCPTQANIKPNNSIWSFVVVGSNAQIIINKLYNSNLISLDRKYNLFDKAMAWIPKVRIIRTKSYAKRKRLL